MPGPSNPKGPASFKGAVKRKVEPQNKSDPNTNIPRPYIVEQIDQVQTMGVNVPQVSKWFSILQSQAIICRFNGFWPKAKDLHHWICTSWTSNCEIHLCSRGVFVVQFANLQDVQFALNEGPWFWGSADRFITPWFPRFDANTMVVSKMPLWIRLHNLPLPFWHHQVLEGIENTLGKFVKIDLDKPSKGNFTFVRICEVDHSKGFT